MGGVWGAAASPGKIGTHARLSTTAAIGKSLALGLLTYKALALAFKIAKSIKPCSSQLSQTIAARVL